MTVCWLRTTRALVRSRTAFGVSRSYVIKVRQRRDRLGDVAPGAQRSHTLPKLAGHDDTLRARVAEQSDQTLEELREWLLHTLGISVSVSNLCGRLRKLGLTLKKKSLAAAEQDRADIAEARRAWNELKPEARSQAAGFPGRDLDQDQHDQVAWPGATGPATDRQSALWTLEDEHIPGRFATRPGGGPSGTRRRHQRLRLPSPMSSSFSPRPCTPATSSLPIT